MCFQATFETRRTGQAVEIVSPGRRAPGILQLLLAFAFGLGQALLAVFVLSVALPAQAIPGQAGNPADTSGTVADKLGVNIHFTDPLPGEVPMLDASGVRWVRMDLNWSLTERARGQYDFSVYDRLVQALEASHLRAMFILDYCNALYDQNLSPVSEEARQAFANWAVAAVTHFRGRGFLWEIYNEPNAFWQPRPNTEAYLKLALATSEALAEATPGEEVVGPASAAIDPPFLEAVFRAGLLNYWSAVTIHPYRPSDPETADDDLRDVRLLIRKYAPPGKTIPVMAGEWGYSLSPAGMDEHKQAAVLAREWLFDLANDVPLTIWYDWHRSSDANDRETGFDLVSPPEGSPSGGQNPPFRPRPAYVAARTLTQVLGSYQFNKRLALDSPADYVLLFTKDDSVRLAVWTTGSPHTAVIPASAGDFSVTGLAGDQLPPVRADRHGLRLTLTGDPQYLWPEQPNELLSIAAAWQRLPLEIEVRAPGVLPLHLSLRNPLPRTERFELRAVGAPFETEGPAKAKPGTDADLMIRVAAAERSITPTRLAIELGAAKLGVVAQETSVVASNPLRVTLLPATARYLPVSIANMSGDPVRGSLRATGNGLRFESREAPLQIEQGVKETILKLALASPPQPDYSAGVDIADEDGNRIYLLPTSSFRLIDSFASLAPSAMVSNFSLAAEAGASPGSLEAKPPPQGPPQPGMGALRIGYDLSAKDAALRLLTKDRSPIPGQPKALGLWIYGDGSGMLPYLRFADSSGQVFQEGGSPLNWKGWRYVLVFMDAPRGKHWGGANDGVIHFPIHWDSLFVMQNPSAQEASGAVYLSGLVLIY